MLMRPYAGVYREISGFAIVVSEGRTGSLDVQHAWDIRGFT